MSGSRRPAKRDHQRPSVDAAAAPLLACIADRLRVAATNPLIIALDGHSARPELHSVLDLRVLLDPPTSVRRQQLLEREGDAYRTDWESRWSTAEDHYFGR